MLSLSKILTGFRFADWIHRVDWNRYPHPNVDGGPGENGTL